MTGADVIQVVIALGTLAAAVAAWRAANASRDTVREADKARQAAVFERKIAMLSELLGLVSSLVAAANIAQGQGERYAIGARIRSLLLALTDYDLPLCAHIGEILGGGAYDVAGSLVVRAEREVTAAIQSERQKLAQLTAADAGRASRALWPRASGRTGRLARSEAGSAVGRPEEGDALRRG